MEVKAQTKFLRIAPRKTRLVVTLIRGKSVIEARRQLAVSKKISAKAILKTLNSAVANAVHNAKMNEEGLMVVRAYVNEGPKIKRFAPRAQGRATPLRYRSSHITIVVASKTLNT